MFSSICRLAVPLLVVSLAVCSGCKRKSTTPTDADGVPEPPPPPPGMLKTYEPSLPRRLLFISMNNYVNLNPLAAPSVDKTRRCAEMMAAELKVPHERENNQVVVVSDLGALADGNFLTKSELVDQYERFLASCRPQDRIAIYFGGHALDVGGKAYLATIEGSAEDPRGLIPLADFYAKLKLCKAVQKVMIWDVCRRDPGRRPEGKGSGPMSGPLSKALLAAPAGVEVITTCQPGENALDFSNLQADGTLTTVPRPTGSSFLEAVCSTAGKKSVELRPPTVADPIPVTDWLAPITARVSETATRADRTQTVRYFSSRTQPADPVVQEKPKPPPSKSALAEAEAIEAEFRVPPFDATNPPPATGHTFADDVLRAYKSPVSLDEIRKNKSKYPFQMATLNAFQTLRDVWQFKGKGTLVRRESVPGPLTEATKKAVKQEQAAWSIGILKLEEADRALEDVANVRKDQPKRWQAHYDYARAVVKFRLAFMNEYNKLMGDLETETIPPLDKGKYQNAYRLVSAEKMKSRKDVQKLAEEAREAFEAVIADHQDTPWAFFAGHEKAQPLGLAWEATKK